MLINLIVDSNWHITREDFASDEYESHRYVPRVILDVWGNFYFFPRVIIFTLRCYLEHLGAPINKNAVERNDQDIGYVLDMK